MSSINLVNNSILAPTRRENIRPDNCILSNEDFPDRPFLAQTNGSFPRRDNILQKQASFIQNARNDNLKSLKHQPSKLDLIDDTKLTSLPLPPPPKMRSSVVSHSINDVEHSIRCSESVSTYNMDDEYDEGIEESEDPIVLVEDYMTIESNFTTEEQKHMNKKDSLAVFKDRIYQKEESSSLSTTSAPTVISKFSNPKTPFETNCTPNESLSKTKITRKEQNLEEIFGKIPGSDSLKYCDLCEKPLYEISSLIDNNIDSTLQHPSNEEPWCRENTRLYSEFVCWECIETYEEFFNELCASESYRSNGHVFDENSEKKNTSGSIRLFDVFQDINQKYNIQNFQRQGEHHFSSKLIQKLYKLNSSADSIPVKIYTGSETFDWVKYLQYQLRWRWRIAGLIPSAFKSDPDQNSLLISNIKMAKIIQRCITRQFSSNAFLYSLKSRNLDKALSLEEFMFRAKVKSTYRKLIRIIYRTHERDELLRYAKHEFAMSDQVSDLSQRRYLLNDGVNKINQMLAMMDLQGSKISND